MLTPFLKKIMATDAFNAQDLGEKSVQEAVECVGDARSYKTQSDYLTSYLVESFNNANDVDDIITDIDYAISQLKKAKEGVEANA